MRAFCSADLLPETLKAGRVSELFFNFLWASYTNASFLSSTYDISKPLNLNKSLSYAIIYDK